MERSHDSDRLTDKTRYSVCNNRPHLCSTAMRHNMIIILILSQSQHFRNMLHLKFWCFTNVKFVSQLGFWHHFVQISSTPLTMYFWTPRFPILDYTVNCSDSILWRSSTLKSYSDLRRIQFKACLKSRLVSVFTYSRRLREPCQNGATYIGWSNVRVISGHITISKLWGNTAYHVKLSCEDMSHHFNKTESAGSRKYPYYHSLTKIVMSQ